MSTIEGIKSGLWDLADVIGADLSYKDGKLHLDVHRSISIGPMKMEIPLKIKWSAACSDGVAVLVQSLGNLCFMVTSTTENTSKKREVLVLDLLACGVLEDWFVGQSFASVKAAVAALNVRHGAVVKTFQFIGNAWVGVQ